MGCCSDCHDRENYGGLKYCLTCIDRAFAENCRLRALLREALQLASVSHLCNSGPAWKQWDSNQRDLLARVQNEVGDG